MTGVCELCDGSLEVGQWKGRHLTCCAAAGGRADDVCRPILEKVDGYPNKVQVCAHCWTVAA